MSWQHISHDGHSLLYLLLTITVKGLRARHNTAFIASRSVL